MTTAAALSSDKLRVILRKYANAPTLSLTSPTVPAPQPTITGTTAAPRPVTLTPSAGTNPAPTVGATPTPMSADQLAKRPGSAPAAQPGGLQVPPNNAGIHAQAANATANNAPPAVQPDLSSPRNFGQQVGDMFSGVAKNWNNMPTAAKWTVGGGLGLGALGAMQGGGMGAGMGALGLGAAGLAGAGMGLFGDDARRMVGQGAMNIAGFFGQNVPTAQSVTGAINGTGAADATAAVRAAMDKENDQGQKGGWAAGQAEIDRYKGQLGTLTGMGRDLGTTMLMGLPGEGAPQTAEEAGKLYDQLAAKHQEISDPNYLYNQAFEQAKAEAAKKGGGAAAALRGAAGNGRMGGLVERGLQWMNNGEAVPQGTTVEEIARNALKERYGDFPMQNKSGSLIQSLLNKFAMQQLITKSARCWAGYEPVPGKKPYSNDSCRPAGSGAKKKKTTEKAAKAPQGCTTMTETASSRGDTKHVDDKQKTTNSPKPEDAGVTQTSVNTPSK